MGCGVWDSLDCGVFWDSLDAGGFDGLGAAGLGASDFDGLGAAGLDFDGLGAAGLGDSDFDGLGSADFGGLGAGDFGGLGASDFDGLGAGDVGGLGVLDFAEIATGGAVVSNIKYSESPVEQGTTHRFLFRTEGLRSSQVRFKGLSGSRCVDRTAKTQLIHDIQKMRMKIRK